MADQDYARHRQHWVKPLLEAEERGAQQHEKTAGCKTTTGLFYTLNAVCHLQPWQSRDQSTIDTGRDRCQSAPWQNRVWNSSLRNPTQAWRQEQGKTTPRKQDCPESGKAPLLRSLGWVVPGRAAKQLPTYRAPFFYTNQGESSSTPVTSDLSKTFHHICLWLHQLVKNRKEYRRQCNLFARQPATQRRWLANTNKQTGYHAEHVHDHPSPQGMDCSTWQVVDRASRQVERRVREALHIYKRQPKINCDSGLKRSTVWNAVLWELALQTCSTEFLHYFIFIYFILFYFIFYSILFFILLYFYFVLFNFIF